MTRTFKVIARHKAGTPKRWRGGPGTQYKKWVYTSLKDFDRYAPRIIAQHSGLYDIELYEMIDGEWQEYDGWEPR
jgi:hypothetical protein